MKTVKDVDETMYTYKDVGVAMIIRPAITELTNNDEISYEEKLNIQNLEKIRQKIYENKNKMDEGTMMASMLLGALVDNNNPIEESLIYIENLMENLK